MLRSRTWRAVAALTALAALAGACGDDDDDAVDAADEATSTTAASGDGGADGSVEVRAVDYRFEGLPAQVPAGATFSLTNASAAEVHEMVAVRVPDGETRSAQELFALGEEELSAALGGGLEPAFVVVALPGEDGHVAVPAGGQPALTEAGRYVIGCFIPIGADPAVYREAIESGAEGPPPVEGPPHVTQGMFAEVTVS
jgi:hypothetical protein